MFGTTITTVDISCFQFCGVQNPTPEHPKSVQVGWA